MAWADRVARIAWIAYKARIAQGSPGLARALALGRSTGAIGTGELLVENLKGVL